MGRDLGTSSSLWLHHVHQDASVTARAFSPDPSLELPKLSAPPPQTIPGDYFSLLNCHPHTVRNLASASEHIKDKGRVMNPL